MKYAIKSAETGLYFSFRLKGRGSSWGSILSATKLGKYNPVRFILMRWVRSRYKGKGRFLFHGLVPLQAKISLLGRMK